MFEKKNTATPCPASCRHGLKPDARRVVPLARCAAPLSLLLLAACASAPAPREARLDGGSGLAEALGRPVEVDGVVGAELTLDEIRRGTVEPRCAEAGLVMVSLRVRRRPDGAQDIRARCGRAFVMR